MIYSVDFPGNGNHLRLLAVSFGGHVITIFVHVV